MAAPELDRVTLRPLPALGRMAIALHGELDVASGERLAARAIAAMIEGWDVDLDLSAVTFADRRGMHALDDIRSFADECGREVALDAPSRPLVRLAELL